MTDDDFDYNKPVQATLAILAAAYEGVEPNYYHWYKVDKGMAPDQAGQEHPVFIFRALANRPYQPSLNVGISIAEFALRRFEDDPQLFFSQLNDQIVILDDSLELKYRMIPTIEEPDLGSSDSGRADA